MMANRITLGLRSIVGEASSNDNWEFPAFRRTYLLPKESKRRSSGTKPPRIIQALGVETFEVHELGDVHRNDALIKDF